MSDVKKADTGRRLSLWLHSESAKCALVFVLFTLLIAGLFATCCKSEKYNLTVGSIANQTINATKDVVDEVTTEERRNAAAAAVEPTYRLEYGVTEEVMSHLSTVFGELRKVQQYGLTLEHPEDIDPTEMKFSDDELEYAQNLVTEFSLTRYQATTMLRCTTEQFDVMVTTVTQAVQNALNTTIREGQINGTVTSIQQIVGYRVDIYLTQIILPAVLRTCLKPNMVVEAEATEAARQKARESVENVVYLQGQCIVRAGDRVNRYQYEMLKALGMLSGDKIDLSIYIGAASLTILCMLLLYLLLRLLCRDILRDLRHLLVLLLTVTLAEGFCLVCSSMINPHLAPVVLVPILLTVLLGYRPAMAGTVCISLLTASISAASNASYTTEMLYSLIIGLCGGTTAIWVLKNRPGRMWVLLAGLAAGIASGLVVLALSLMTSNMLQSIYTAIGWMFTGCLLSGALAIALQAVFEMLFNLATPSKLLELGNPKQPLLRKLLMEAPGTYHHSIIVGNLAEAAAEKIGANPLLARTAAYFHDVGKLKRPMYFKENQIGDNPLDRTDPYVSAAIVTAHTRDGMQLAQKYHLPREIQQIILEHHGDTPVMFFYHKATQLAGDKPVDIADFRYAGPRPSSRESAIIMMADTVEAAVRSMSDPTPESIRQFIQKLIKGKLEDGQLSNSPLTLKDVDDVCLAFATVLNGVFHERIEYPTASIPARTFADIKDKETSQSGDKN